MYLVKSMILMMLKVFNSTLKNISCNNLFFLDNFELTGWAAFVLLAGYMAISNILLVNLLVAMFS